MKVLIALFAVALVGQISAKSIGDKFEKTAPAPYNEELIVESVLNIKPKNVREKRQFGGHHHGGRQHGGHHHGGGGGPQQFGGGFGGGQNYGQSSSQANANAFSQNQGPGGFGASAANAGAQGFQSQGPLGGFGASAANAQTQSFQAGPGGIQGSAGLSGSQTYNLPGGHHIDLAYGQTYGANNGQVTGGGSNSLTYTK